MVDILAIDPGTTHSGWVLLRDGRTVLHAGIDDNETVLRMIANSHANQLAIEMIASYGMAVGREVFETCVWIGRFQQAWREPSAVRLVYRREVKLHLCGNAQAKDGNVRQALLDLWPRTGGGKTPQVGTKDKPGPLYGVSSHAWPALGVAIVAEEVLA